MTAKRWLRSDEWAGYAPCRGNADFTIDPVDLGPLRTQAVKDTCAACPVRPECIRQTVSPVRDPWSPTSRPVFIPSSAVWTAGEWLPDMSTPSSRQALTAVKDRLVANLSDEELHRPEHLL